MSAKFPSHTFDPARPWIGNLYDVRREDRKEAA